jgi:hypothetical protein
MRRRLGIVLHPRHTVLALALTASLGHVNAAHAEETSADASHDRYTLGITAAAIYEAPGFVSLGFTGSYAPVPFFAFGAEASWFALVSGVCSLCADGPIVLPFAEVRTPWRFPVNVFARFSAGVAVANRHNGVDGTYFLPAVRAAAGPEFKAWHVYLRPFVFWMNKLESTDLERLPIGVELGGAF